MIIHYNTSLPQDKAFLWIINIYINNILLIKAFIQETVLKSEEYEESGLLWWS